MRLQGPTPDSSNLCEAVLVWRDADQLPQLSTRLRAGAMLQPVAGAGGHGRRRPHLRTVAAVHGAAGKRVLIEGDHVVTTALAVGAAQLHVVSGELVSPHGRRPADVALGRGPREARRGRADPEDLGLVLRRPHVAAVGGAAEGLGAGHVPREGLVRPQVPLLPECADGARPDIGAAALRPRILPVGRRGSSGVRHARLRLHRTARAALRQRHQKPRFRRSHPRQRTGVGRCYRSHVFTYPTDKASLQTRMPTKSPAHGEVGYKPNCWDTETEGRETTVATVLENVSQRIPLLPLMFSVKTLV